jgi:hypothetical protein
MFPPQLLSLQLPPPLTTKQEAAQKTQLQKKERGIVAVFGSQCSPLNLSLLPSSLRFLRIHHAQSLVCKPASALNSLRLQELTIGVCVTETVHLHSKREQSGTKGRKLVDGNCEDRCDGRKRRNEQHAPLVIPSSSTMALALMPPPPSLHPLQRYPSRRLKQRTLLLRWLQPPRPLPSCPLRSPWARTSADEAGAPTSSAED